MTSTIFTENDFPSLGMEPTSSRKKASHKGFQNCNTNITKKIYVEQLLEQQYQRERQRQQLLLHPIKKQRTEYVKQQPQSPEGTRVCKYVKRKDDGTFGVCYRPTCTFAHSLESFRDPNCQYGQRCLRKAKCHYRHPNETHSAYFARLGKPEVDLPKTDEHTRQPKEYKTQKAVGKVLGSGHQQKSRVDRPKKRIKLDEPVHIANYQLPEPRSIVDIMEANDIRKDQMRELVRQQQLQTPPRLTRQQSPPPAPQKLRRTTEFGPYEQYLHMNMTGDNVYKPLEFDSDSEGEE